MPISFSIEYLVPLLAAFCVGAGVAYLFIRRDRRALAADVRSLWERLDAVFYRSPVAICLCELNAKTGALRILDCNEEASVLHGGSRDDVLASGDWMPALSPEQRDRVHAWFKSPRPAELWRGECNLRRLNGVEVPIAYVWTRVEIGDRELVLAVELDVSEQRQAETALKESEQRFRQLIETADCLLWKAKVREAEGQFGWKFDIPLSGLRQRLFAAAELPLDQGELWSGFNLPEFATMNERCAAALRSGDSSYRQEFPVVLPRETMWLQERVEIKSVAPGEWELVGVIVDITRMKESEAAIRTSEEKNRLILKASNDGIWDYDVAAQTINVSERGRAMLGLRPEDASSNVDVWRSRMHPDDLKQENSTWRKHRGSEEACVYQARFRHEDGSWRWFMVRAITVINEARELVRVIGSHTDITELKRNESELQQGRRLQAIGELVGGIAHEFNNLLTPMLLETTTMIGAASDVGSATKERLKPVVSAIKEARDLTQRILTFGRRSASGVEPVELGSAIHEHLELLRHTIDRRVMLNVVPPATPIWVQQNRTDFAQVIINLVLNARDTLLEKVSRTVEEGWVPTISIRFSTVQPPSNRSNTANGLIEESRDVAGQWHRVTIRDNGMGMLEEVRERIFEPFYTTKQTGQGTGLGLATVWHLVTAMGGKIEVETRVGTGSAFHVSLPAIVAPTAATNGKLVVKKMASAVSGRPARILLVDDQPDVTASLSRILDRWGHHVTILSDGSSALQKLVVDGSDFDVCITDLNMPGATGFEVVKLIREAQLPVKVVVMGGYLTGSVREGLEELNVDAIVPKPFSIEDIEAAMRVSGW